MNDQPSRSPAFQFYADDFFAGTADMSQAETGAYIRLLCHQWNRGSIPVQTEKLERLAGGSVSDDVLAKFPADQDGARRNPRLELERQKQANYREMQRAKGIASGKARITNHGSTTVQPELNHGSTEPSIRLEPNVNSPSPSPSPSPSLLPSTTTIPNRELSDEATSTTPKKAQRAVFVEPSEDEVRAYALKIGLPDSQACSFWHHYEANGWKVGSNKMKKWTSAMFKWKATYESNRGYSGNNRGRSQPSAHEQRQIDCDPSRNGAKPHDLDAPLPFA